MEKLSVKALRELARELGLSGYSKLRKEDLLAQIKRARAKKKPAVKAEPGTTVKTGKKPAKSPAGKVVSRTGETTQAQPVVLTAGGETEEERIESAKYFFAQTHDQYPQHISRRCAP